MINGLLLISTRFVQHRNAFQEINWRHALIIGIFQVAAILPAISRSGITISLGLLMGLNHRDAFDFSFLLAIPITLGAAAFELVKMDFSTISVVAVLLAILSGGAVSFLMLTFLRKLVLGKYFYIFAFYCWTIGILVVLFLR